MGRANLWINPWPPNEGEYWEGSKCFFTSIQRRNYNINKERFDNMNLHLHFLEQSLELLQID